MSVPTIVLFPWSHSRGSVPDGLVRTLLRHGGTARAFAVHEHDPLPILLRQWSAAVFVLVTNEDLRVRMRARIIDTFAAQAGPYQEMIVHAVEDDRRGLIDQLAAAKRQIGARLPGLTGLTGS